MGGLETGCGVEERGTDHEDQQGDEGGAGDATEQARESVRMHGEQVATVKNTTENTRRATSSESPAGSSGSNISNEVEEVRGMARHGPIAR